MRPVVLSLLVPVLLVGLAPSAHAHFNMLLPENTAARRGQEVAILYQWGHPFEHQLFEAPLPESLAVIAPDGKKTDLSKRLKKIALEASRGRKVAAYKLTFTPEQFGDYFLVLKTPAIWMPEEKIFFQDTVKTVLHVQTQEGWDAMCGTGFEMVPLTRPYGLQPGMVFQAQVLAGTKGVPGTLVEIERYHHAPPKQLPSDEQMTRAAKSDPNGVVTCTLTEAGWWCLTARRDGGTKKHEDKEYPVWQRTTFWVHVDKTLPASK